MTSPRVTVLLPVYNGAVFLRRSLESLLNQTFRDFEIVAINDGSKDDTAAILDALPDPRLRVYHQDNIGLAGTLNRGLSLARGALIARQDQDDFSQAQRLARQVAFLETHPRCALLGTAAEIWVGDSPSGRTHDHPLDHPSLAFELLFNNPFVHSSIMMRREHVLALGGYSTDPTREPPEDYELWSRLARRWEVANLPDRLLIYREVPNSMSRSGPDPFLEHLVSLSAENLAVANGREEPDRAMLDTAALTHSAFHRLSARPNIRAMVSAILGAAERIGRGDPEVQRRAAEHERILRYQWMAYRSGSTWVRPVLRHVRQLSRHLPFFRR